jgi:drug/metabolite transporter (DMT)-like permease
LSNYRRKQENKVQDTKPTVLSKRLFADRKSKGIFYAIIGSIFWGLSGTAAQYLFSEQGVESVWLVSMRLVCAGILLLLWYLAEKGWHELLVVWKTPRAPLRLVLFAYFGMLPSQLTYFMAIKYGNASTATILQFLGPLFILLYLTIADRRLPRRVDVISIVMSLFGTFLLVTQGRLDHLALAPLALIWGVAAGVSAASYTLLPRQLLKTFDARLVIGWAMMIGSVPFLPFLKTAAPAKITGGLIFGVLFVITIGTMFSYLLYLKSIQFISPSTTGMLNAFEPLTATIMTVLLLHTKITPIEVAGALFIIGTTFLQTMASRQKT